MSEQSGYPGAPPGWYPDPAGGPGRRWWDGYAWTEATVLPAAPPPPPWPSAAPPQGSPSQVAAWPAEAQRRMGANTESMVSEELGIAPVARFAVVLPAVYHLVQLINLRVNASGWRYTGHYLRIAYDAGKAGRTTPTYHATNLGSPLTVVFGLATIAAVVVACIWQYRAATVSRALGFPSRRSPGWGVGAWFVPIVNFWVPYGAIRDCLPSGDPQRALVLRWWLAWVIASVLTGLATVCAFFSTAAALAFSIPAAIALVAVVVWAPGIVMSIAVAHRRAVPGSGLGPTR